MNLEDIKNHLRVQHDQEDDLITTYWNAAIGHVDSYLDGIPDPIPAPVEAAILLLIADMYEHRTWQMEKPLSKNATYTLLLNPYRSMEVC